MSRKIDALVAERVMGWTLSVRLGMGWPIPDAKTHPVKYSAYSTDISAAWEAFEKMGQRMPWIETGPGPVFVCVMLASDDETDNVETASDEPGEICYTRRTVRAEAAEASMAICLCTLRAVGVTEAEIQEALCE